MAAVGDVDDVVEENARIWSSGEPEWGGGA